MVAGLITNQYLTVLDEHVPDFPASGARPLPDFPASILVPPEMMNAIKPVGNAVRASLSVATAVVPPRTGKGSSADVWRTFLRGQGVELTDRIGGLDNATKGELIDVWDAESARRNPTTTAG